jgi:hypothetical protein
VDIATRFIEPLDADASAPGDDPDLLPVRPAHVAAAVLGVDGVGLNVYGEPGLRTPPAASSEVAATAERLQFNRQRDLPARRRIRVARIRHRGAPGPAGGRRSTTCWTHTPRSSVLALSLRGRLKGMGRMDLYLAAPDGATAVDAFEARCVAELVSDHLEAAADWSVWTPTELPAWADTADARRRGRLWMAVGMLLLTLEAPAPDALAALRGYAYAAGRTADDVPVDLVERRLQSEQLREDAGSDH